MIMKNEEEELPLVIASAAGLADEIVIYDTGSTDRSVAVARRLGATVVEGYWDDDFARARNEALEHCAGEWILWLDADEAISGDKEAFRSRLNTTPRCDCYVVAVESLEGGGLAVRSAFHAARVFRRERCHWFGPIHEQVGLRGTDAPPPTETCSELRILHRGYTMLKRVAKDVIERNLQIARRALDDPGVDRSRALFDYGRTLTESDDPSAAVAPLRQAADTTTQPSLRRAALRAIFYVHLLHNDVDGASEIVEEMRVGLTRSISVDVMGVKLLLWKKEYEACLEAFDRLPFSDTDEDGFEYGRASLAWVKAQALDALGRHGEAADALLDALRTHGQLDEGLGVLVGLLRKAGRSLDEVAAMARPESMPVLVAMASRLPSPEADEVLAAFAERYRGRLEPLAAAREVAAGLGVPRAMWWADRFRRAGLGEMCPLLAMTRDEKLTPSIRLLAAGGGYLSFRDERFVAPARAALAEIDSSARDGAIGELSGISPELARVLSASTRAVRLSRRGTERDGYVTCRVLPGSPGAAGDPAVLAFASGSVHELVAEDVLASVPHDRAGAVLAEWARVLCDGGLLHLEVPNLEAAEGLLAAGRSTELRRLLFGGRRFGADGAEEANADAWSPPELTRSLAGVGLLVEELDPGPVIAVSARRTAVQSQLAAGEVPPVCVLVVADDGAEDLLRRLRALSETPSGVDFETVVLVNGPDERSLALSSALEGDVTRASSPVRLEYAAALDEAARLARAETIAVLSPRAVPVDGWLGRLVTPLRDPSVAISGAAVVDGRGLVTHAGFDLVGDSAAPALEAVARSGYLRAEAALGADADVDAVGAEAFALRRELWDELRGLSPGWAETDAVTDLCLRARSAGRRCVVAADCAVTAGTPGDDPLSRERLSWHWAGRTSLRSREARRVSASSLMPTSTLIERVSRVMEVPGVPRPGGVNLVGDFGDHRARCYAASLSGAGMPVSRLQWAGGLPAPLEGDVAFAYATTLLLLDGDQLVDYVGEVGLDSLRDRRTVLAWDWPLSRPSAGAAAEAAMVGEIWVPSSFTHDALSSLVPRPVLRVPPPVTAPRDASRAGARLPDGFVFAQVVRLGRCNPGDEVLANPRGTIEAFTSAFAPRSGPVLCVVLQGRKTLAAADACRSASAGRPDVLVIETDDPAVAEAASVTADCLVSLHRASAFAPDLARALAVGCPVVATGYGGPMDFLSHAWAELVPYELTSSSTASHPFPAGTEWAEPDLEAAAAALRSVHDNHADARRKAWQGRLAVTRLCGPKTAARVLRRRLGGRDDSVPRVRARTGAGR